MEILHGGMEILLVFSSLRNRASHNRRTRREFGHLCRGFRRVREGKRNRLGFAFCIQVRDDDRSVGRGTRQICITVRRNRQCEFPWINTQVFCNRFRIRIGDLLGINYLIPGPPFYSYRLSVVSDKSVLLNENLLTEN